MSQTLVNIPLQNLIKIIENDAEFFLYLTFPHMIIEQQVTRKGFIELFTFTVIDLEGEFNWIKKKSLHLQINLMKGHP